MMRKFQVLSTTSTLTFSCRPVYLIGAATFWVVHTVVFVVIVLTLWPGKYKEAYV
ncbi:hypothetical protein OCK74_27640 [Chitinophagaceae bacterium LB-8]|uniref:Uncharacterized protein n=1 Tax=Paraflavisolibacter caeni TaxID=2982496 RepID=A0A9X3BKF5_9BACT|nr:hypothetical protein [Paraflavisolibacter caeni]MCU7552923.1 hypothetical protein [Paraflavisolibacter caeni]